MALLSGRWLNSFLSGVWLESLLKWDWLEVPFGDQQLIEGVGNEVIALFTLLIAILIPLIFLIVREMDWSVKFGPFGVRNGVLTQSEIDRRMDDARNREDQTCPICIADASYAAVTNCNHIFCWPCIHQYWVQRGTPITPITCATCRTPITFMLPYDWPLIPDLENPSQLTENEFQLAVYNRRFSAHQSLLDYIENAPEMIRYAIQNLVGYNALIIMFRVRVVLIFAAIFFYLLTPLDLLPDSAYGLIGIVDDVFVVTLFAIYGFVAFRNFGARRQPEAHND